MEENNSEVLLSLGAKVRRQYLDALKTLSRTLSSQVAQYDMYSMVVGTVVVLEVRSAARLTRGAGATPQPDHCTGVSVGRQCFQKQDPRFLVCSRVPLGTVPSGRVAGGVVWATPWGPLWTSPCFPAQVLALLLLSVPQALGASAELDVPLSPMCSLLFYLTFLLLWAVHVVVCTSAESSHYLCSLTWPVAGGVLALVSALLCGVLSTLTRTCVDGKLPRRVRLAPQAGRAPCVGRTW